MSASPRSVGLLLTTSIASLLIGWVGTRAIFPQSVAEAKPKPQVPNSTPSEEPKETSSGASPSLTERFDEAGKSLGNNLSNTERTVAIFALAETLRIDEFSSAIATAGTSANLSGAGPLLFGYWMERDLAKALEWYERLDNAQKSTFSNTLLQTWVAIEPREALEWLEKQPEAAQKSLLRTSQNIVASKLAPLEPDRVFALLAQVSGDSGMIGRIRDGVNFQTGGNQSGVVIFFSALAAKAPADAAARAMRLPSGTNRTSAALSVARTWAAKDPIAAKAWAEKIDDAALAAQVIPACAIGLAEKDPKQAAEWLGELAGTLPNREGMKEVMAVWGRKDIEGALAWLDSLPEESGAGELTGAVFNKLGEQDPERMMRIAKRRLDEGKPMDSESGRFSLFQYAHSKGFKEALRIAESDFQHPNSWASMEIYRSLVNGAAQDNPKETAAWALQQPSGDRRREALELSASFLLRGDEETAFQWMDALPKDKDSDEARLEGARRFFDQNPERAGALFAGMTDREEADGELMSKAYWALLGKKPGFSEWLDKTPVLTATQKAKIRAQVNKRK
jgi:hypothetical protein